VEGKGVGGRHWTAAGLGSQRGLLSALQLNLGGASARFGWGVGSIWVGHGVGEREAFRCAQYPAMSRLEAGHSRGVSGSVNWLSQF
jgi:hypothetical protein